MPQYRSATILPGGYLTLVEAGERLGLSASTLRQQARKGTLRAILLGKTYIVASDEVERYRVEHRRQP